MPNDIQIKQPGRWKRLPRWSRISIWSLGTILFIIFLAVALVTWYINNNKKSLIRQINEGVQEKVDGNFHIGDLDVTIFKNFPNIALRLKNVTLSDSLYDQHKRNLLELEDVYVFVETSTLFSAKKKVKKITLANGSINLFTEENGYTNGYLLKGKGKELKDKKEQPNMYDVDKIGLEDILLTISNAPKNKLFKIEINDLDGYLKSEGKVVTITADIDGKIHQLGFNQSKGAFLVDTKIKTKGINVILDNNKNNLTVDEHLLHLNESDVTFASVFSFDPNDKSYKVKIKAENQYFANLRAMLNRHISSKFKDIEIDQPMNATATFNGIMQYPDTPIVNVHFEIPKANITTPVSTFTNASVIGTFNNRYDSTLSKTDENSVMLIEKLRAEWESIPVSLDSSMILNFKDPIVIANIKSTFNVEKLEDLVGDAFDLRKGTAEVNIKYRGPIGADNKEQRRADGFVKINNAALTYLPRNLKFDNSNVLIQFVDQDLLLKDITLHSKSSTLKITGTGKKFLSAYFNDKYKAIFDLTASSKDLDLNEFKSLLATRGSSDKAKTAAKSNGNSYRKMNHQLDEILALSDMHFAVNIGKVYYKNFMAHNVRAQLNLLANGVELKNVNINHAGGNVQLNATLNQNKSNNPMHLSTKITKVNVDQLFKAFDNFGMSALKHENIKGLFSGDININGEMDNNGDIKPRSFRGTVKFNLENAALMNFDPFLQIKKYVFRNRNLENVTLKSLSNELTIANGKVTIPEMEVITSAIYMNVQGVYALDKGTDLVVQVPLRNPSKDEARIAAGKEAKRNRGLVVHLRAQDGEDGKIKVAWDPQKKGLKEAELKKAEEESNEDDD